MNSCIRFAHPEPVRAKKRILPVFLPFAGCPHRCIFCDQTTQTGQKIRTLFEIYNELETTLAHLQKIQAKAQEIAFYGGTFTALPMPWPKKFIELAYHYKQQKLITRIRCSTRPDAVSGEILGELSSLGLDMVELGIQSFDTQALMACKRGYTGEKAREACTMVLASGLGLGIQLLPGLPGDRPGVFLQDCEIAAQIVPETMRLYPCMVLEGTPLAYMWKTNAYQPWDIKQTRQNLSAGLGVLWKAKVQVIRIGLAPEPGLEQRILAGPLHPALGQMIRGLALFQYIRDMSKKLHSSPQILHYPHRYSGEIYGFGAELTESFQNIGITQCTAWEEKDFLLQC